MKQVARIPLRLQASEPRIIGPVCRARSVVAFLFGEEVDVGAAGREPAHVAPALACPLDVLGVVGGVVPGGRDIEDGGGVTVATGVGANGIAVGPGGTIYLTERLLPRVRALNPVTGRIRTIVGSP